MDELILIINNISRYGLQANVNIENKEQDLEKHLVYLYAKYFEIKDTINSIDYPCYQRPNSANFRENISLNFPALGWYHHTINSHKVLQEADLVTGDAIDDLADIILELLEVQWRYEHNSLEDATWFFKFIFQAHIQQHLLDLLSFFKSKNG